MGCSASKPSSTDIIAQGTPGSTRAQDQAVSLEQIATQRLHRYTKPESIWAALEKGHVRLVRATYLMQLADEKGTLRRRQELPESAFIGVEELKALYGDGNEDGVLPIISISFCWDTAADPDPSGKQLATVAAKLKEEMAKYKEPKDSFKGFTEMGIFWDWASLYQKDPGLFDASETPDAKPEGAERDAFLADLKERGVAKLNERQKLCNTLGKAVKEGTL